jgi:hypothetical protein
MNCMRRQTKTSNRARFALILIAVVLGIAASAIPSYAQIPSPVVLYTFQGGTTDVWFPWGPMAQGQDGNLYGTGQGRGSQLPRHMGQLRLWARPGDGRELLWHLPTQRSQ